MKLLNVARGLEVSGGSKGKMFADQVGRLEAHRPRISNILNILQKERMAISLDE